MEEKKKIKEWVVSEYQPKRYKSGYRATARHEIKVRKLRYSQKHEAWMKPVYE